MAEAQRYRPFNKYLRIIFYLCTVVSLGVAVFYIFGMNIAGSVLINIGYYYLLIALYLPFVFLFFPAKGRGGQKIPWYDLLAAILAFGISLFFFLHSWDIVDRAWAVTASPSSFVLALILCLLILESGRRIGGLIYFFVCLFLGLYPILAPYMPGILGGQGYSFTLTVTHHAFGHESLLGIPMKVVGEILIGFLIFAAILIATGAGKFFLDMALSLVGRFRGGPAKVSIVASAFFGSMSGSVFSNIVGTGSITIPTMKNTGYPPKYAGAIEACASTGGVLMPPVMGAVAFVMCELLEIPYATVIICAIIPSILYYLGLLMQVDAYAAKVGLKGMARAEIPPIWQTLKGGWHFIAAFIFLIWGLVYMRWEAMTPFYASGLLILLAMLRKETRITLKRFGNIIDAVGKLITETTGIILPIGLVIGGLFISGVSGSFSAGIVSLGGGNPYFILLFGIAACYVMGMMGMLTAAYIMLAVTLAPALMATGVFDLLAVHLFIIYYAMLSTFTPPVAAGAFLASSIAGAKPMQTAWQAVRLGVVIYFIPFFFVFNPALVLRGGTPLETIYLFLFCVVGIILLAGGLEGYLVKVGLVRLWARPFLVISGLLIGFPEWKTTIIGAILALFIVAIMLIKKRRETYSVKPLSY